MNRKSSHNMAFCGIFGALMLVAMLGGNLLAVATFCAPVLAGILLIPVLYEKGYRLAWVLYLAVSLLSLMLIPDMEMSFTFLFVAGPYPMVQRWLNHRLRAKLPRVAVKAAVFNVTLLVMYSVLIRVFPVAGDFGTLNGSRGLAIGVLVLLGNLVFYCYDRLLVVFLVLYQYKIRPKLKQFL